MVIDRLTARFLDNLPPAPQRCDKLISWMRSSNKWSCRPESVLKVSSHAAKAYTSSRRNNTGILALTEEGEPNDSRTPHCIGRFTHDGAR